MKRVFSFLLALLLVAGLVPVQAMAEVKHNIIVNADGGTASASTEQAAAGETVIISYEAYNGNELKSITVTGPEGSVQIYPYDDEFIMPDGDVTVNVTFGTIGDSDDSGRCYVYYVYCMGGIPLGSGYDENVTPGSNYSFVPPDSNYTISSITDENGMPVTANGNHSIVVPEGGISVIIWLTQGGGNTPQPTEYTVSLDPSTDTTKGSVSFTPEKASEGTTVTFKPSPNDGCYVMAAEAKTEQGNPVGGLNKAEDGSYSFTMPAENVRIYVLFQEEALYNVEVAETQDGTVTVDPVKSLAGKPVVITPTPKADYEVQTVTVTNKTTLGTVDNLIREGSSWKFWMPASDVKVQVEFVKIPTYTIRVNKPDDVTLTVPDDAKAGEEITLDPGIEGDYIPVITIDGPDGEIPFTDGKFTMPDSDVTITVTLKEAVTVTFRPNGGTVSCEKYTIEKGSSLNELPAASWENHIFMGWYLENDEPVTVRTAFSKNTVVYAYWSTVNYEPTAGITVTDLTEEEMDNLLKKAEEENKVTLGKAYNAVIYLDKKEIAAPAKEAETAITRLASGDQVAAYLDLQWYIVVDGGAPVPISNDGESARIKLPLQTVQLPDNLVHDSFYLIYYHKGQAKVIWDTNFDVATRVLEFEGNEFSPYALVCKTYQIEFMPDGGGGSMDPVTINPGDFTLPENSFNPPSDKEFAGWKIGREIKQPGEKIRPTGDVTITAAWKDKAASAGVLDNVPKTGDSSALPGWTLMVLCSTAMLTGVAVIDKKRAR